MSKVVHISEAASIAIHSLAIIASSPVKINARQISQLTGSSLNHLSKVMQLLVKNGYIISNRGPSGGFVLNTPADKITLLEVYEYIEGVIDCQFCGIPDSKCPFVSCVFGSKAETFTEEFKTYLRETTISNLTTKRDLYEKENHSN
ncbi:MAG: Rrf2 family transcriptional regulator [Bacteroidetes bacterium]|nr:Rrf2 family transcriptional regulator [Bacteroidota bacterium]